MDDEPYLQISWRDRETGCRGYLVIDRLVRGVSSGGIADAVGIIANPAGLDVETCC